MEILPETCCWPYPYLAWLAEPEEPDMAAFAGMDTATVEAREFLESVC